MNLSYSDSTPNSDPLFNHPLNQKVIGCAMEVHTQLGPGLLESTYETCLARELAIREISFRRQTALPIEYKGLNLEAGYRLDLYVEDILIVELKSVDKICPVHQAQILTYMKLAEAPLGLIINFNVKSLKDGIKKLAIPNFSS